MSWAMVWSLSAAFCSLLVGALLVYILRKVTSMKLPANEPPDEKSIYEDDTPESHRYISGSPLPAIATASDSNIIDRDKWVLRLTRHVFRQRHESKLNVVVINKELEYHFNAEGIIERHDVTYHEPPDGRRVTYDVVVFREGVLHNLGDGGDINWDWMGNFERSGRKTLTFKPCETQVGYIQDPWLATVGQARQQVRE